MLGVFALFGKGIIVTKTILLTGATDGHRARNRKNANAN